jgi:hypothetical protein
LGLFRWGGFLAAATVVVVATTSSGHEREPQDESKELEAPALSSHFGGPPQMVMMNHRGETSGTPTACAMDEITATPPGVGHTGGGLTAPPVIRRNLAESPAELPIR